VFFQLLLINLWLNRSNLGKAEEELPASFQTIDGINGLVYLVVQGLYLLLAGCGQQEVVHLGFQVVVNLQIETLI